ncbi:hypothetical protein TRFO_01843 [Tritrichomonas foetus]|uniref:Uncharacterized protein n=1 Tax=Tritrichomonas foetus TaxID=1144522 RepID=A0A1J4JMN0_9EUKA|nr:hypothetical protein TRFO_01843 [Tritrichomonas foetus]|eukprot:OHS98795.1 hypothetical protein TRFO_01843 [Tritrichomonas foetus]
MIVEKNQNDYNKGNETSVKSIPLNNSQNEINEKLPKQNSASVQNDDCDNDISMISKNRSKALILSIPSISRFAFSQKDGTFTFNYQIDDDEPLSLQLPYGTNVGEANDIIAEEINKNSGNCNPQNISILYAG